MTIKEIASIANVSVSTVSKIVNKNDESISSATRERVLKVIKEYNYKPYSSVKDNNSGAPFLVGVLIDGRAKHERLLINLINSIRRNGYTALVNISNTKEEEFYNLVLMSGHQVKGIIWDRVNELSEENEQYLIKQKIVYEKLDFHGHRVLEGFAMDYVALGAQLTQILVDNKHRQLVYMAETENECDVLCAEGFKTCLFENNIPFDNEMLRYWSEDRGQMSSVLHRATGIVCGTQNVAVKVVELAVSMNLNIPKDLSIICLEENLKEQAGFSEISSAVFPYEGIAGNAVRRLVDKMEGRQAEDDIPTPTICLNHLKSIDVPRTIRNKKIVVVGTINMDTIIRLEKLPESGETVTANTRVLYPGGKGMNQAVAASRLGAEAYLIGKLGRDYDGSVLYDYLKDNHVNIEGVSSVENVNTGHAYIYVQKDGESSIAVYQGANQCFSVEDVEINSDFFENASYCLVQTEISLEIVEYVVKKAAQNHVRVILKPTAISELSDEIVKFVDILMPNRKEIDRLLPDIETYEAKAQYYLDRGAKNVIITLGHKGCYFRNHERSQYYPAFNVTPVDTTGAADAFAAALSVYLSKNNDIEKAIEYATVVAGISTTKPGAAPSMPDQDTLGMYLN